MCTVDNFVYCKDIKHIVYCKAVRIKFRPLNYNINYSISYNIHIN